MKDLHLKYHSETGVSHEREIYGDYRAGKIIIRPDAVGEMTIPTEEYISWLEELAEKYLKQKEVNAQANKITAKFKDIKLAFDNLKSEVGYVEEGEIIPDYQYNSLNEACDQLEAEIYD